MSPVPASAITIADGDITIDAELLAPKLGLSAEALKAEMRKGNVSSVAETGIKRGCRTHTGYFQVSHASLDRGGRSRRYIARSIVLHAGRKRRARRQSPAGERRSPKSGRPGQDRIMTASLSQHSGNARPGLRMS